ncbi:MAG: hypothetical protein MAG794_01816 [Gammaproteobacteria bacterium]|nr:hypothetical protein [Gammaproteobacteria bacterium]
MSLVSIMLALVHQVGVGQERHNLVAFENGTVLLRYSSEYGDRSSANWLALGLIDGTAELGWASGKSEPPPHEFLFELFQPSRVASLLFLKKSVQCRRSCGGRVVFPGESLRAFDSPERQPYPHILARGY